MTKHNLTSAQAEFFNRFARAAHYYKKACREISSIALHDVEELEKAKGVRGPNHQVVNEYVKYFGEYKALEDVASLMWDFGPYEPGNEEAVAARKVRIQEFEAIVALAVGDNEESIGPYYFLSADKEN